MSNWVKIFEIMGFFVWHVTYLSLSSDAAVEALERYDLFVLDDVLQVLDSTSQGHVLDGVSDLARILEVHSQVRAARFHRLRRVLWLSRITRHFSLLLFLKSIGLAI